MTYQPPWYKQLFHLSRRLLAKQWLSFQPALQIALTGSHGKTNTTHILTEVLKTIGSTVKTDLNLDTTYNVPITALKILPWTKFAVFELGVDREKDMDAALEMVKPTIAIITGIAPVHTDKEHLGSLQNLIKEKRKLVEALPQDGYSVLNYDDENVRNMASHTKAHVIWYGTDKSKCHVWVDPKSVKLSLEGTLFTLDSSPVSVKLMGKHHIYTVMAVYATLKAIEKLKNSTVSIGEFSEMIKTIKPLPGRMSLEKGPMETVLLNDSLRANPSSTKSGLETVSELFYDKGRKVAILGEMGELENPEEEHKKIGKLIGTLDIDYLISMGPFQKFVAEEAVKSGMNTKHVFWVKDVFEAADKLKKILKKNDLIYLKGSLLRHVERIPLLLEGKKIGCNVTLCPFYHQCPNCQYRENGYQNK